jgi:hypothetical protein
MTTDIDPGLILFSIIFSISGASCCITLGCFLYRKYLKKNKDKLEVEIKTFDESNNNPYNKL